MRAGADGRSHRSFSLTNRDFHHPTPLSFFNQLGTAGGSAASSPDTTPERDSKEEQLVAYVEDRLDGDDLAALDALLAAASPESAGLAEDDLW